MLENSVLLAMCDLRTADNREKRLDEVWAENPSSYLKRTGRDSNPLDRFRSLTMYSAPAVECVSQDRRSDESEPLRCSAIELRRDGKVAPVGFEPTTPGVMTMYSNSAVGLVLFPKAQRGVAETVPFGTPWQGVDVVPTGSWAKV